MKTHQNVYISIAIIFEEERWGIEKATKKWLVEPLKNIEPDSIAQFSENKSAFLKPGNFYHDHMRSGQKDMRLLIRQI